jgi:hypothetical protein
MLRESTLLKLRVFWDVLPCSQVDIDRRFRVLTSETSVIYLTRYYKSCSFRFLFCYLTPQLTILEVRPSMQVCEAVLLEFQISPLQSFSHVELRSWRQRHLTTDTCLTEYCYYVF